MLGVIVELELQAIDMPWVRFSEMSMDLATFLVRRASILSQYDHVWVHWTLGQDVVQVECLESRTEPAKGFHRYVTDDDDNASWENRNVLVRGARRARSAWRRARYVTDDDLSWENRKVHVRGGRRANRPLRHGRALWSPLSRAAPVSKSEANPRQVWMSMQYGVSAFRADAAIDSIRASDFSKTHSNRVLELKFLRGADGSYLGPNADGDAVLFNLWWLVDEDLKDTVFDSFETLMRSLHARPHWGKLHRTPDVDYMQMAYPRWAEFETVRARFDPSATFSIFPEERI